MILDEIAERTVARINDEKKIIPVQELRRQAEVMASGENTAGGIRDYKFYKALKKEGISFICEVKKASPSKGIIADEFPYLDIAKDYEASGADAVSCLTEPYYFKGSDEYLKDIAAAVSIPVLRKDLTVDEYMIYQAKILGADAVLLICSLLETSRLKEYLDIAHSLGLSALVEAHDEKEIESALESGAGIIGVNNRDLKTFEVDIDNSVRLRKLVPDEIVYVSESGIKTADDIAGLVDNGTDAVLIGETFMRSGNKKAMIDELRGKR